MPHQELVPLPPLFASRFRGGVVTIGVTLTVLTPLMYAFMRFVGTVVGSPGGPLAQVVSALPPLFVVALAVTLLVSRCCLHGDNLIVSRARGIRNALFACLGAIAVSSAVAVLLPVLTDPRQVNALTYFEPVVFLFIGMIGFASGHMFVRPSLATLRRFAEGSRSVW
ncbi:hypothetical protein NLX83_08780 [Allokutzneria sp. A3M-2-11 16]|uniref:hypothetical protein n=1 Tax=Allokutzneria sp. A3M-2-11 16 TaxID=2962043 RepID=UPI0020B84E2A|nr:hypothetical protein [Allokutzneria sp. A3M-2-11 16]MCP3799347.1 hypothetical protein [Allokutzneria sp. A3M-2-11 16]